MKFLKNFFIAAFIFAWIIFAVFIWAFQTLIGKADGSTFELILNAFVYALLFVGGSASTLYFFLRPKMKFLKSNDKNVPPFGNKVVKTFTVEHLDFHFEVVKYKIKEEYEIILYDDTEQYIIKFHPKLSFFSRNWGTCGTITYDAVAKTVTVTCFPVVGYTEKAARETQIAIDEIESLIVNK